MTDTPTPADPHDVSSIDAIIEALYDVISGPAGQARDYVRLRSLFFPGARLIPSGRRATGVDAGPQVPTVEEYIEGARPVLEGEGFFEREIGRRADRFGRIAHALSAYESRRQADDAEPFTRGVNSIQLVHHDGRWWVVTVFWDSESPDHPIPAELVATP